MRYEVILAPEAAGSYKSLPAYQRAEVRDAAGARGRDVAVRGDDERGAAGDAREDRPTPGAYPHANAPQLWNSTVFPLLVHTLLGLQPLAPLNTLVVAPALPVWLPEIVLNGLRVGSATAKVRFWRDETGRSHAEILEKTGTLHLIHQQPLESLAAGAWDRFRALLDTVVH